MRDDAALRVFMGIMFPWGMYALVIILMGFFREDDNEN